ncbi:MAG TPA: hypothetical protein VF532_05405 [Candidatus Angelobacter sp.]
MFIPGETACLLCDVPETALKKGAQCEVLRLIPGDQGVAVAAEVKHYAGSSARTAVVPVAALEPVLSSFTEQRTAVLWGLEKPPEDFMPAAIHSLLERGLSMSPGRNVVRLYYDHQERWWKRDEPIATAFPLDTQAITHHWHACIVAFSSAERYHLEFRLKGRGEACVLLHEREEAYAEQARRPAAATDLARVLINLADAAGARYCAFPVAGPWLLDEDWPALLRAPYYPDFFLLPGSTLPMDFPEPFRGVRLTHDRVMITAMPVKFAPHDELTAPSERDHQLAALRKAHALGEKYYDQLYEARGSTAGIYSDIKDAFLDAISAASALGLKEEAGALETRLENIKGVYRSQFS